MGCYRDQVLPRLLAAAGAAPGLRPWRQRVCDGLTGRVVEIGFGAGANLDAYPAAVTEVLAVEPAPLARRLAARRLARSALRVSHAGLDGEHLELDDDSCDAALVTFTLCTLADPAGALGELRRVLRPGGRLHFLEHGLAPDPPVARLQARLDPLQHRLAGGCRLTREPLALLDDGDFALDWAEQAYASGPKPWTFLSVGVAHPRA